MNKEGYGILRLGIKENGRETAGHAGSMKPCGHDNPTA